MVSHYTLLRKNYQNVDIRVGFLLDEYYMCAVIKLRSFKLSDFKSETSYTKFDKRKDISLKYRDIKS